MHGITPNQTPAKDPLNFIFGSTSDDPCTPLEGSLLRWGEFYAKLDKLELYEG